MDGDDVDPADSHRHYVLEELNSHGETKGWKRQIERLPGNVGFLSYPKREDQASGFGTDRCLYFQKQVIINFNKLTIWIIIVMSLNLHNTCLNKIIDYHYIITLLYFGCFIKDLFEKFDILYLYLMLICLFGWWW